MPGLQRFGAGHLYHSLWGEISTDPLEEESSVKYLLEVLFSCLPCIKDSCLLVAPHLLPYLCTSPVIIPFSPPSSWFNPADSFYKPSRSARQTKLNKRNLWEE
jgi:hypothetical protein